MGGAPRVGACARLLLSRCAPVLRHAPVVVPHELDLGMRRQVRLDRGHLRAGAVGRVRVLPAVAHGEDVGAVDGAEGHAARERAPHERARAGAAGERWQRLLVGAAQRVGVDKPEGAGLLAPRGGPALARRGGGLKWRSGVGGWHLCRRRGGCGCASAARGRSAPSSARSSISARCPSISVHALDLNAQPFDLRALPFDLRALRFTARAARFRRASPPPPSPLPLSARPLHAPRRQRRSACALMGCDAGFAPWMSWATTASRPSASPTLTRALTHARARSRRIREASSAMGGFGAATHTHTHEDAHGRSATEMCGWSRRPSRDHISLHNAIIKKEHT